MGALKITVCVLLYTTSASAGGEGSSCSGHSDCDSGFKCGGMKAVQLSLEPAVGTNKERDPEKLKYGCRQPKNIIRSGCVSASACGTEYQECNHDVSVFCNGGTILYAANILAAIAAYTMIYI